MSLQPEQFSAFFQAVWGTAPFPWQRRLAAVVMAEGWPDVLDLPTGTGKTAVIDVALFAMAVDAARPPAERRAPRRIVMVVDRRVVVDQGYDRARALAAALSTPATPVVAAVADALRGLGGDELPLDTAILRGGIPRSEAWVRSPGQPLVAVSTVDQVGSRLLFRGYGVSGSMRPVHAGLLGNDTLFLLDEVHLSEPFRQTLRALAPYSRPSSGLPRRQAVVELSATPRSDAPGFALDHQDRAHPVLAQRLSSRKPATLVEVKVSSRAAPDAAHEALARAAADQLDALFDAGARAVGVVLNRVASARATADLLRKRTDTDVVLLTGRMRPLDRDGLVADLLPRVRAGRTRSPDDPRLVVVATQCIEAGADLDFDALITECASLDALRQRFGRLDRLGALGRAPGVILCRTDQVGSKPPVDPVYGEALAATWDWLCAQESVDFGVDAQAALSTDTVDALRAPAPDAPVLLPSHVHVWMHTRPVPSADPDVSLWLHGPQRVSADVQICWRADVTAEDLADPDRHEAGLARVAFAPPGSGETISISLRALRAWLSGGGEPELADVDGAADADEPRGAPVKGAVVVWRGEDSAVVDVSAVRPGDTVVVPAGLGGIAHGNWDPAASDPVVDLGDLVQARQRGRSTLRLHPDVLDGWMSAESAHAAPRPQTTEDPDFDLRAAIRAWAATAATDGPGWLRDALTVAAEGRFQLVDLDDVVGIVARKRRRSRTGEVSTEDDTASFTARAIALAAHCGRVRDRARLHGQAAGLPAALCDDVALAGWLHDVGKADPRFQRMLVGGDPVRHAMLDAPLAKSPLPMQDLATRRRARDAAGYPPGTRHELLSSAMAGAALQQAHDPALVAHLVASHHGWCRPFAPAVDDPDPRTVHLTHGDTALSASTAHGLAALDGGVADRFWSLNRRYGPWGLAWLEALLRLADQAVSAEEQEV